MVFYRQMGKPSIVQAMGSQSQSKRSRGILASKLGVCPGKNDRNFVGISFGIDNKHPCHKNSHSLTACFSGLSDKWLGSNPTIKLQVLIGENAVLDSGALDLGGICVSNKPK